MHLIAHLYESYSGKEKAHKHKQIFLVTASPDWVARGLPTGGQGSKVYVLCAEPNEHKHFRPGTRPGGSGARPGGSVTGVTEKLFMCQMFMCLFRPLTMAMAMAILRWPSCDASYSKTHQRSTELAKTIFDPRALPSGCPRYMTALTQISTEMPAKVDRDPYVNPPKRLSW